MGFFFAILRYFLFFLSRLNYDVLFSNCIIVLFKLLMRIVYVFFISRYEMTHFNLKCFFKYKTKSLYYIVIYWIEMMRYSLILSRPQRQLFSGTNLISLIFGYKVLTWLWRIHVFRYQVISFCMYRVPLFSWIDLAVLQKISLFRTIEIVFTFFLIILITLHSFTHNFPIST